MKYIVVLVDGMADEALAAFDNQTPLEKANIPTIHALAGGGKVGMVYTVPGHLPPGSDVANLSVMGYDPDKYHRGRSPLEAASIGVPLKESDVTFRANFVTLEEAQGRAYEDLVIQDHSSGDLSTEEAAVLIEDLKVHFAKVLNEMACHLYTGVSYRHLLLWENGTTDLSLTPPHDILGQAITAYLPKGAGDFPAWATGVMKESYAFLKNHPINLARKEKGLNPANSLWFWGEGRKPQLTAFETLFGVSGHVISAVDLIKGIGHLAGLTVIEVEGATGNLHTNFKGKGEAALQALLSGDSFSYIHLEAPDECGHQGDYWGKVTAIEKIDSLVVAPLVAGLREAGEAFRIMIVPDHPTPVRIRTHTREPVPYLIYDSRKSMETNPYVFTEKSAAQAVLDGAGRVIEKGFELMHYFIAPELKD